MKANNQKPSEAELEILQVLWAKQPCTVKEIHAEISKTRDIGYTTTLKQMQRMHEKGLLTRAQGEGKSFLYKAEEKESIVKGKLVDRMVKNVFGDSVKDMMMAALGKRGTSKEEIDEIKAFLNNLDQK